MPRLGKALIAFLLATGFVGQASASDPVPDRPWAWEMGARYWYSTGTGAKDLFDNTGGLLISRLTYDDLTAHSGEIFFRGQHASGLFLKGYVGVGTIGGGSLTDEDFPPVVVPYSNTTSSQDGGSLGLANIDVGAIVWQGKGAQVGAFIGYHYWQEKYDAFGCRQNATSLICAPAIPTSVAVISQENTWHSLRLGLMGDWRLSDRLSVTGEAAYVRTRLDGVDRHHLRPAINPLPEDGEGGGVMLEVLLKYQVTDMFNVGIGARYWKLGRTDGHEFFVINICVVISKVLDCVLEI
jgi:hypothetical protein